MYFLHKVTFFLNLRLKKQKQVIMKKFTNIIVVTLLSFVFSFANAQTNLFFSEYAEGSSNNKYFEIYNPTADTVDLSNYAYPSVANAPSTPGTYEYWNDFDAGAVILPYDVYVVAHGSADASISAEADETHTYLSNGDDGYGLVYGDQNSYVVIDWIGNWDADPGAGWSVAGISNATKDHTLVRKCDVTSGNNDWTASAGTDSLNSEWTVYPNETWTYLGSHVTCPLPPTTFISYCSEFTAGPAAWPHVLVAATASQGAVSQGAQTFTMNVTSLPAGGANFRVFKTTANGGNFFGNAQTMTLGINTITVSAVGFDRAVKFQFSNGAVAFDALSLNGVASSCIPILGCTDSLAWNYDVLANYDDGSCLYSYMCNNPYPNGLFADNIVDIRATIHWNNMNTDSCRVWKNFIRYKKVTESVWTTKAAGVGSGLCNVGLPTQQKVLQNLTPNTTYEYKMKSFYCGGMESGYSPPQQFTTAGDCPPMTNLSVQTFGGNHYKARFSWDTTGTYVFARIALRIDTAGASWQTVGGFGVYYPSLSVNKFGLQSGQSYRAQGRTFCDSNITIYRSWWTPPIFWTQPGSIRQLGGESLENFQIYPNPTTDIFNVSFVSEDIQSLYIRILNVVGEEIYEESLESFVGEYTKQINLKDYSRGVYFLEINGIKGTINKKIILQ